MFSFVKENDARKLSSEQQKLLRIKAVDLVFTHGHTRRSAAKLLGVSRVIVSKWCQAFEEGGYDALELGRRGRRPQEQQLLRPHKVRKHRRNHHRLRLEPNQEEMPLRCGRGLRVRELIL